MTQSSGPQPPLNERLADILLKAISAAGLTAGGAGAFWQLFNQDDLPKAIASAAIGLGISYGATLLQPLHKGNQRRLEQAGKALDQKADQLVTQASGFKVSSRNDDATRGTHPP
ncbi:MAG: hypothetical protein AAF572_02755 [Cyanobacteria bacterium P01_B01_bin.77]